MNIFFNELGVTKWEYVNRYKDYIIDILRNSIKVQNCKENR